jgi:hypothetical protein
MMALIVSNTWFVERPSLTYAAALDTLSIAEIARTLAARPA